jgi:subtilisin family serine protease
LAKARKLGLSIGRKIVLRELGLTVTRLKVKKGSSALSSLRRLFRLKTTGQYELNHYYQIAGSHKCKDLRCYAVDLIHWNTESKVCMANIKIGMVDTQVDIHIPSLSNQHIIGKDFILEGKPAPKDHGTSIATILVGAPGSHFPGLLPSATLYAASAFSSDKTYRYRATALAVARALNWLISRKVIVINLSFAGPPNKLLRQAVRRTLARGIPLVAAAGNFGPKAPPTFPAAYKGVIAVTAVDRFCHSYRQANRGMYINFSAPGVSIWTPGENGRGQFRNGTSYSAAYVTALSVEIISTSDQVKGQKDLRELLKKNALDLGRPGRDRVFGWGLVRSQGLCNVKPRKSTDSERQNALELAGYGCSDAKLY